jgi:hypothetical protein
MTKRLGQNPFEDDFRKKSEKYLEPFFKQKNVLTKSSYENNQTHEKINQHTNKHRIISNYEEKLVSDYLIKNGISTTLDISTSLNLDVYDTVRILQKLESKRMIMKAIQS